MEMKERLISRDYFAAWEAAEYFHLHPHEVDIETLISAFHLPRSAALRAEIIDVMGLIGSEEIRNFLVQVAKGRGHHLVRYYAMRNLIELGCDAWHPNARQAKTDFYASLLVYERFVRGEMELEEVRGLAWTRSKAPGDHWQWLAHLNSRPAVKFG